MACEYSGRVRTAFRKRGHDAYSVDLLPSEDASPYHVVGDVLGVIQERGYTFDLMIAHPPCTYLTNSGVRWLHEDPDRWIKMGDALDFFMQLWEAPIAKICIENPAMHCYASTPLREAGMPRPQYVQPWWFGERTFKLTGYALKGLPKLVATDKLVPPQKGTQEHKDWSWIHRASPGPERWKIRSRTPYGIATAMAEQWG